MDIGRLYSTRRAGTGGGEGHVCHGLIPIPPKAGWEEAFFDTAELEWGRETPRRRGGIKKRIGTNIRGVPREHFFKFIQGGEERGEGNFIGSKLGGKVREGMRGGKRFGPDQTEQVRHVEAGGAEDGKMLREGVHLEGCVEKAGEEGADAPFFFLDLGEGGDRQRRTGGGTTVLEGIGIAGLRSAAADEG